MRRAHTNPTLTKMDDVRWTMDDGRWTMDSTYYVLDDNKQPVPVGNYDEWAKSTLTGLALVALTKICEDVEVSTVFLGVDHSFVIIGSPMLFETMVFGGPVGVRGEQHRYATWQEAEAGHAATVEWVLSNDEIMGQVLTELADRTEATIDHANQDVR